MREGALKWKRGFKIMETPIPRAGKTRKGQATRKLRRIKGKRADAILQRFDRGESILDYCDLGKSGLDSVKTSI